jgi:hypothetical protein
MTKSNKQAEEIADLKREVAELKAAVKGDKGEPKPARSRLLTKEEQDDYQRGMDALRHRNESFVPPWLREACRGGVSDSDARAIATTARAPVGPTTVAPSSPVTRAGRPANVAGSGTGWAHSAPLGPSPHQRYVDQQLDAADARDKAERIKQEGQLKEWTGSTRCTPNS